MVTIVRGVGYGIYLEGAHEGHLPGSNCCWNADCMHLVRGVA